MIDRTRLREFHGGDLPLHILEQDYVQALFLQELYRESEDLVFKGGTYLKHAHGLDRFSEDLDFTAIVPKAIPEQLRAATNGLNRYGLPADIDRIESTARTVSARLRYEGPLYDGTERSRGTIDLEISTREDIFREPEWLRLFFPYPETRAVTARCLHIEEAFAEKLRALATRTRGRDLYDCWYLIQQGIAIDPALVERKLAVVGAQPEITISITEREWDRDLSVLVEHPPAYETVLDAVTDALRTADLSATVTSEI